jgi:regulator of replication initiation timing
MVEVLRINNLLKIENKELKEKIETQIITDTNIQPKLNNLTPSQFSKAIERINAMLLMIGKEAEPVVIKEMEGAEL